MWIHRQMRIGKPIIWSRGLTHVQRPFVWIWHLTSIKLIQTMTIYTQIVCVCVCVLSRVPSCFLLLHPFSCTWFTRNHLSSEVIPWASMRLWIACCTSPRHCPAVMPCFISQWNVSLNVTSPPRRSCSLAKPGMALEVSSGAAQSIAVSMWGQCTCIPPSITIDYAHICTHIICTYSLYIYRCMCEV